MGICMEENGCVVIYRRTRMISLRFIYTLVLTFGLESDGYQRTKLQAIQTLCHSGPYLIVCNIIHLITL